MALELAVADSDAAWLVGCINQLVGQGIASRGEIVASGHFISRKDDGVSDEVAVRVVLHTRSDQLPQALQLIEQACPEGSSYQYTSHDSKGDVSWGSIERLSWVVTIIGLIGALVALGFSYSQVRAARVALEATASSGLAERTQTIDEIFVSAPELRPFFFESKELTDVDVALKHKVEATAELILDFFDQVIADTPLFDADMEGWNRYIEDMFQTSPVLHNYLRAHCGWWPEGRFNAYTDSCRGSMTE